MFTQQDLELFNEKGMSPEEIEKQLESFKKGFPWLKIVRPAVTGDGIVRVSENQSDEWIKKYSEYAEKLTIVKFVPASGAASRMFKSLFEYVTASKTNTAVDREKLTEEYPEVKEVFDHVRSFAFSDKLDERLKEKGSSIGQLLKEKNIYELISFILFKKGLNYGSLPKGLILFHAYKAGARTAMEEHFVEGAKYGKDGENRVNLHFTVSPEHHSLFLELTSQIQSLYEDEFGVHYKVDFSYQKPSTDTIAVDLNNEHLRDSNGKLIFRPGGHGALLENLNELEADIVFVKNIDNVAPDRLKEPTVRFKKILGGVLLDIQEKIFSYLKELEEKETITDSKKDEIREFLKNDLSIDPGAAKLTAAEETEYFRIKLNRPVRVCGMVKNTGEPGGGPFIVVNPDGTASPQIVEASQMDMSLDESKILLKNATHFNPVDLICSLKNYKGEKFDLMKYRDMNTGFISMKSKDGVELKALELPGLWNGAMSDWNTIFVEVPIETFSPVKTINDLLRTEHQ